MEHWRQCALWLINCRVLPPNHRVTWESAQVFDLAQTLRDGVLLCQLLNNLRPQSINLREINLRPQMSQFLCLKNIRTFLHACSEIFGMKKSELFEAFDLFDVRDFGKVMDTLSKLSHTHIAQQTGIRPFPTEESVEDEDIYNHLEDLIDENGVEDEEDLYDCVYDDDEGGEVYEDLMKVELVQPQKQVETDIRSCCLMEIKQTEEKYTETLDSIEKFFMKPLGQSLSSVEIEKVFINIPELVKVHMSLLREVQDSVIMHNASNLFQIFIKYKERLVLYGKYCSQVELAIAFLDDICKNREDVRQMLELCSKRANNGKFTLRDLLVVPMQRVLKYHLLLQELVKHTHDATDKSNLRQALDAMKDLAQYVNEVKRDIETLRDIDQYQKSIENLNQSLRIYGRPKGDSEVRVASVDKRAKQDRHIFLFDAAVIVCKRRGDNYEMKEVIDLHSFKITNNPTSERENRKWCHGFYLTHNQGQSGFEFFFKTKEVKKKWLEQFGMALSNICPESGKSNSHEFRMHTFETTTSCSSCKMLLRGVFYQGYRCSKCGAGAHKECLGRVEVCVSSVDSSSFGSQVGKTPCRGGDTGLPKMTVIRNYYGVPSPLCGPPLNIQVGDVIEVMEANIRSSWWKGRVLATKEVGFFPSDAVKPCPCVPKPVDYSSQPWFAGPMERLQAEEALLNRTSSTYLVRHRSREFNEYAISIKYNNDVKHIKILTKDGLFHIAENRKFRSILELIEYYKHNSLREGFRTLDTTLQFAYREPENGANMFAPKVMGVAIARYDFCSRDMRELSLQEGDVVKIYSKTGAKGWWKGEVSGRVGWFPSTYVEEGEE
ncbi:guanine nucleotide exchange factor VAV3-like [Carassius auratus]|uniref:Guanine nucleotide exchange factor VAV3-like n=1 Tax=Carassius auratus TaxID=7957 RepID=A0A6P6JF45_CARAU|nr:guanine nucleotide exchange factor VAV3-like [Carassius auratus]XP_052451533.1 guanine nucleotide exchange factor VAV3 isoform X1 [Carassius gibelio]